MLVIILNILLEIAEWLLTLRALSVICELYLSVLFSAVLVVMVYQRFD